MNLADAEKVLADLIQAVYNGAKTPEDAVSELEELKKVAPPELSANYTLEDFQQIAENGDYELNYVFKDEEIDDYLFDEEDEDEEIQ